MCALWSGGSQNCHRLTHQKIWDVCWGWVLWKQNQARESVVIDSRKGEACSKNSVMFKELLAWGQCDPTECCSLPMVMAVEHIFKHRHPFLGF